MVMIRSSSGMNDDRTFRQVVLPDPVPPDTKTLSRAAMQARRKSNISGVAVPNPIMSSTVIGLAGNFRTVITGPISDSGSMIALTREPSGSRASTRGLVWSIRRPSGVMIRSMMRSTCSSLRKTVSTRRILPPRSMYRWFGPLTMISVTVSSASSGSSGPSPPTSPDELLDQAHAFGTGHREAVGVDDPVDDRLDLGPEVLRLAVEQGGEDDLDLVLQLLADLAEQLVAGSDALGGRGRRRAPPAVPAGPPSGRQRAAAEPARPARAAT